MKETAQEIIDEVLEESGGDIQSAIYALEDGEYLGTKDWGQADIEDAWDALKSMLK